MKTRLLLNPPSLSVTSRNLKLPQKLCGFERIWKSSPHSAALMTAAAAAAVVCSLFALHPGMMISNISNDAFSDVFSAVVRASRRALQNVDVVSSSFQPSPRPCLTWTCRRTAGGTPEKRRNEAESPAEPSVSQSVRRSGGQPLTSPPPPTLTPPSRSASPPITPSGNRTPNPHISSSQSSRTIDLIISIRIAKAAAAAGDVWLGRLTENNEKEGVTEGQPR